VVTVVSPASPERRAVATGIAGPARRRKRAWTRARVGRLGRPVAAVLAGVVLSVSFPPHDLWMLSPIAVAVLALVVRGRRPRTAYGLGVLFGLGLLVPLLAWSRVAGTDGWLVLSVLQALLVGVVGPLCVVAYRLPGAPFWIGTAWIVQEAIRDRVPFGGFPWGRLAFVQPAGGGVAPITRLAALGGAPLVTFTIAFAGGLLAAAARHAAGRGETRSASVHPAAKPLAAAGALVAALALLAVGWFVPVPNGGEPDPRPSGPGGGTGSSSATVAAIQGNVPRAGLDWVGQRRAVTRNHLARTEELAAAVTAGRTPAPDLVIWPENSSDLDPFRDPQAAALLSEASRSIGRPLLVGAVLEGPGAGHVRNAGLVWGPSGYLGSIYVKRHPVPFGEYLPGRALLQRLVGRFAADLPNDFLPGKTPGNLSIDGPGGTYRLGDVICFEVAYDGLVRDVVDRDARLLVVQTNNATFGHSGETYQQMAMSRLRAIEHGRSTAVVATSGRSALITPNGSVLASSGLYTSDVLVASLPLRSNRTLADRLGTTPEYLLVGLGVVGPLVVTVRSRRSRPCAGGDSGRNPRNKAGSTA
jgi:apolipoprotein N-acyltransferase